MLPLLAWWFLLEILTLLALPLTLALLRHLPDRGYPFARVAGILLPSFVAWFLGMWQLASYGLGLLILGLVVVAAVSGWLLWKDRSIWAFLRSHWRLIIAYEVLFAVALFGGAVLRIVGPWGGVAVAHTEQPMDFAFLNGILQSRALPPQDPWLSGYTINYYYLGYFLAASQTLLAGIPAAFAFNCNLATLFALAVTGCFSLGYNLTLAAAPAARRRAAVVGALAVLFSLLIGNQAGALELTGSYQVVALDAGEMGTVLAARLRGQIGTVALGHTVNTGGEFGGKWSTIDLTAKPWQSQDYWWWPSRVLWDERPTGEAVGQIQASGNRWQILLDWRRLVSPDQVQRSYTITEFPFFSFYLGDMHPHVMALPLTLLAIALALNVALADERGRPALGPGRWSWFFLVLNALVLGGLYMANSWDFPTYLLLYGAAWVWRWRKDAAARWNRQDTWAVVRDLGIVLLLAIFLYLPFYLTFRSFAGSSPIPAEVQDIPILRMLVNLPGLSKVFQTIGPVLWDKTSLYTFLVLFGLFLYPALTWLLARVIGGQARLESNLDRPRVSLRRIWEWVWPRLWSLIAVGGCVVLAIVLGFPLLLLLVPIAAGYTLLKSARPAEAFVLLLLLLALLLVFGCELVYIRDIFESRMNTIFKFYYQVWMLLAIAGAWGVGEVLHGSLRRLVARLVWAVPLLFLVAGGLVYPVSALRMALAQKHAWTLDALSDMQQYYKDDYAGVQWLRANAAPDAVILEAVRDKGGGCEWNPNCARISMATGRPTLIGWEGHEQQWRGGQPEAYGQIAVRRDAVTTIYTSTDVLQAQQLLSQYGVDYVYVGTLESAVYPAAGLAKFAQLGTLVFEAPGVQIYRIPSSR